MSKRLVLLTPVAMLCCILRVHAQTKGEAGASSATITEKTTSISEETAAMQKMPGYFNFAFARRR